MLDYVVMRCNKISQGQEKEIINTFKLEKCQRGDDEYWASTAFAKFDGIHIVISNSTAQVKCNIHKLWSLWSGNALDNSKPCRMSQAQETLRQLLIKLGNVSPHQVTVSYYEIGLNLKLEDEALQYISEVVGIGDNLDTREMFVDANFEKDRQKTTSKSKTHKKVLKIYDKSYEAEQKRRKDVESNILRVETIYRRQGAKLIEFFDPIFIRKMLYKFYKDWSSLAFVRSVKGIKGVRHSQLEKARELLLYGHAGYLDLIKGRLARGDISPKMHRDCREFARDWSRYEHMFTQSPSMHELEYKDKILNEFQYCSN